MSSNFWANKINNGAQPAPSTPQYSAPQSTPPTQAQPVYLPPDVRDHQLPQSATTQSSCPGCRGKNYTQIGTQVTQSGSVPTYRCYDCGYPLVQAGSSHGGANSAPSGGGPAQAAKQVATGGFNPTTIIGHI